MAFSSILFLLYFLPAMLTVYYLAPIRYRNFVLFVGSLLFYAWGEPVYVFLLVLSVVFNFFLGKQIDKAEEQKRKKWILIGALLINLLILFFFKYVNPVILVLNSVFGQNFPTLLIGLPLGLSFYTFHGISYLVDIYRGNTTPEEQFIPFGAYLTFFPKILGGPVVRYQDIRAQLLHRRTTIEGFSQGIISFVIGLCKKVLLADNLWILWSSIQETPIVTLSALSAWLGIIVYGLMIYFDISGYCDMSIGLGRMLGFTIKQNFDYPHLATSVTEFWSRWNISLGAWFRQYLYLPLSKDSKRTTRVCLSLILVWLAVGLWHGATLNFCLWGLYFSLLFVLERVGISKLLKRLPKTFGVIYTLFFVWLGWVFFSQEQLFESILYLKALFGFSSGGFFDPVLLYDLQSNGVLLLISTLAVLPYPARFGRTLLQKSPSYATVPVAIGFLLCIAYLVSQSSIPFIYFNF